MRTNRLFLKLHWGYFMFLAQIQKALIGFCLPINKIQLIQECLLLAELFFFINASVSE